MLKQHSGLQGVCGAGGRAGFTLIELLVVIAIISLLVSILLPSLKRANDLAKSTVCVANLRQVVVAVSMYAGEHEAYPAYRAANTHPSAAGGTDAYQLGGFAAAAEISPANPPRFEMGILHKYAQSEGVAVCPAYQYLASQSETGLPTFDLFSYGLNLGATNFYPYFLYYDKPLAAHKMIQPGETLYYADVVGVRPYMLASWDIWGFGVQWIRPHRRHVGKANLGFADGHASTEDPDDYFINRHCSYDGVAH